MSPDTGVYEIFMEGLCSYPVRSELWLMLSASRRHCFNLEVQRWDLTGSYQGQRGSKLVLGRSGDSYPLSLQPENPSGLPSHLPLPLYLLTGREGASRTFQSLSQSML